MTRYTMFIAALIAALAASAAFAQNYPPQSIAGGDTLELQPHHDHAAQLVYHNSAASRTTAGTYNLCLDAVCVSVMLDTVPHSPRELIVVTPQDGFIAVPPEAIVKDGDSETILIVWPMF